MRSSMHCSGTALSSPSDSISAMARMNKGALERLQERIRTADRGWFFAAVADKVSERRQAIGLSQRELAELVGTTQSAIARLERGGRPPRIDTLLRIADALECDLVVDLKPRRH
jgi:predicted transcriptional regulator